AGCACGAIAIAYSTSKGSKNAAISSSCSSVAGSWRPSPETRLSIVDAMPGSASSAAPATSAVCAPGAAAKQRLYASSSTCSAGGIRPVTTRIYAHGSSRMGEVVGGDEASGVFSPGAFCVFGGGFWMSQVETRNRATSSEEARKDVLKRVEKEGVEFVLLWFTDLEGHLKSFAITPSELQGALDDGMGFDGSSITGFNAIEESDMVAIPDPGTFQVMPWKEGETRVGRMICDVVTPDGQPYEGDPRYVLRRALERMQSMGFDTFNVGPELEYFLFE